MNEFVSRGIRSLAIEKRSPPGLPMESPSSSLFESPSGSASRMVKFIQIETQFHFNRPISNQSLALQTIHCEVYNVNSALCTLHSAIQTIQPKLQTLYTTNYALQTLHCKHPNVGFQSDTKAEYMEIENFELSDSIDRIFNFRFLHRRASTNRIGQLVFVVFRG